jgi:hypothetical protein
MERRAKEVLPEFHLHAVSTNQKRSREYHLKNGFTVKKGEKHEIYFMTRQVNQPGNQDLLKLSK